MIDLIGNHGLGALTGGLGVIFTSGLKAFSKYRNHKHEIRMREMDMRESQQEAANAQAVVALETAAAADREDAETRRASYVNDASTLLGNRALSTAQAWVFVAIETVRKLMRPVLTIWLTFHATMLAYTPHTASLSAHADVVIYLASTAITWWFGARVMEKATG